MLKIFIGYDHRQPISYNVLQQSIFTKSSKPVSITPLVIEQLPVKRMGLTPFTFTRFLVPYLCNYEGWGLFLDIDMLLKDDISKLFDLADEHYCVMAAKNSDPRLNFERASVMLFNCAKCKILTPGYIEVAKNLHGLAWAKEEEIGLLPPEWNHLVGYDDPNPNAKLVHYTQGVPCFPKTKECEYAQHWHQYHQSVNSALSWEELMGNSVHSALINGELVPKFIAKELLAKGLVREK
jgi:lipopolysaccharide biosynthesis glycosyltransferase